MQRNCPVAIVLSIVVLTAGFGCESKPSAAEESDILRITVGEPTKLSDLVNQASASLAVSRTGGIAAFYPKPETGPEFYRTSTDAGLTWGPEMSSPPEQMIGGQCSGMLPAGVWLTKKPCTGQCLKVRSPVRAWTFTPRSLRIFHLAFSADQTSY